MPAPSDDDIFKRMFASFVARKTRPSGTAAAATTARPAYLPRASEATRKPAADQPTARALGGGTDSPTLRQTHQSHHQTTSRPRHDGRPSPFPSFFQGRDRADGRRSPDVARARGHAGRHARSKGSKTSKGSKGSKGSEKQVSASTEDAPPKKRTRTHTHPALQRSQSAHAGSLHSSRGGSKSDKPRQNARFNLPSVQAPLPPVQHGVAQAQAQAVATASGVGKSGDKGVQAGQKGTGGNDANAGGRCGGAASSSQNKSFPCDKCHAVFAQKGQLSRHTRRVHEKLRPHACDYCGRLFGARSDRTRHVMIVHKKVRQFPCERCGFQFQAKTHLEAHVRTVHEGERPYRCEQCGFSFGLRSNLLTHERAVHYREAKWNCTVCDTAFNRKHDMFRHMKLMHDIDSSAPGQGHPAAAGGAGHAAAKHNGRS